MMNTTLPANDVTADHRESIQRIIDVLRHRQTALEGQRLSDRVGLNVPVQIGVSLAGSTRFTPLYSAWGLDLSEHGVGLLVDQPIPTRMRMHLDLSLVADIPCILPARMLYCRQLLSHTYQVGAVFLWVSSERPER